MEKLPHGELKLHATSGAINTNEPLDKVAEATTRMNTPEFLEDKFFNELNPSILSTKTLESGGKVTVMQPSGPYSEDAVMVIARGPQSYKNGEVLTQNSYDFPFDTQVEYVRTIMSGLKALHHLCEEEGTSSEYSIFGTENCMDQISDENFRLSRSIALPHSQIIRIDHKAVQPTTQRIDHLEHEQRLLRHIGKAKVFSQDFMKHMEKRAGESLRNIQTRTTAPFGYDISFNSGVDASEVARVLAEHHSAIGILSNQWVNRLKPSNKQRTKPMPSYRAFYHYAPNKDFVVTISPEITSHAGVLEAAGIILDRSPENPQLQDDHTLSVTRERVVKYINQGEMSVNSTVRLGDSETATV